MAEVEECLSGKVALVTDAASGLGKEIALTLARAGAAVAIADLNGPGAEAVAAQIKKHRLQRGRRHDGRRDHHRLFRRSQPAFVRAFASDGKNADAAIALSDIVV